MVQLARPDVEKAMRPQGITGPRNRDRDVSRE
jgi:hypothetical protein